MKNLLISLASLGFALSINFPANADENSALCHLYSKTGAGMTDFLLPLTMQQYVSMMAGNEPELANKMAQSIMSQYDQKILNQLKNVDPSKAELIGEAAGQTVIQLMMSGQASNKEQVSELMFSACLSIGANTIYEEQKKQRTSLQQGTQTTKTPR